MSNHRITLLFLALTLASSSVHTSMAAESEWRSIAGPVKARIIRITDGDTVLVDAHPWPGQAVRVSVRLRGIDTPERHSRCQNERAAAEAAKLKLTELIAGADSVNLVNVSGGKYYGRVLANLEVESRDLSTAMLKTGLARPYNGGKRIKAKCAASETLQN